MEENDKQRRYEMAMYLLEEMEERDQHFFDNILFSDECTFTLDGKRNVQIHRTWARRNPFTVVQTNTQRPQKLNVWCGILKNRTIGPFFIDGNLTAQKYLNLLRNNIIPAIEAVVGPHRVAVSIYVTINVCLLCKFDLITIFGTKYFLISIFLNYFENYFIKYYGYKLHFQDVVFEQDGAGPHTARDVRIFLNETFHRWIGRFSEFQEWCPRSPCLTGCDYFLWGYVKTKLNKFDRIENLAELRAKIVEIIANIPPHVLQKVVTTEFEERLRCCIASEGDIFEYCYR